MAGAEPVTGHLVDVDDAAALRLDGGGNDPAVAEAARRAIREGRAARRGGDGQGDDRLRVRARRHPGGARRPRGRDGRARRGDRSARGRGRGAAAARATAPAARSEPEADRARAGAQPNRRAASPLRRAGSGAEGRQGVPARRRSRVGSRPSSASSSEGCPGPGREAASSGPTFARPPATAERRPRRWEPAEAMSSRSTLTATQRTIAQAHGRVAVGDPRLHARGGDRHGGRPRVA